jgi:hypothetical protein
VEIEMRKKEGKIKLNFIDFTSTDSIFEDEMKTFTAIF